MAQNWLIIGLYVGVIYATLPFAPRLWFRLPGALISFPAVAAFVVLAPLLCVFFALFRQSKTDKVELSPWKTGVFVLLVFASWGLILQFAVAPAEVLHLLEYGGLGFLIGRALRVTNLVSWLTVGGCVLVFLIGAGDEGIQYLLPNRHFEVRDVWLNAWCGAAGLIATLLIPRPVPRPVSELSE